MTIEKERNAFLISYRVLWIFGAFFVGVEGIVGLSSLVSFDILTSPVVGVCCRCVHLFQGVTKIHRGDLDSSPLPIALLIRQITESPCATLVLACFHPTTFSDDSCVNSFFLSLRALDVVAALTSIRLIVESYRSLTLTAIASLALTLSYFIANVRLRSFSFAPSADSWIMQVFLAVNIKMATSGGEPGLIITLAAMYVHLTRPSPLAELTRDNPDTRKQSSDQSAPPSSLFDPSPPNLRTRQEIQFRRPTSLSLDRPPTSFLSLARRRTLRTSCRSRSSRKLRRLIIVPSRITMVFRWRK